MSEFGVSMHFRCFYHGPVISWPEKSLQAENAVVIDPAFGIKTQFMVLLYRLKKKAGGGKIGNQAVITRG